MEKSPSKPPGSSPAISSPSLLRDPRLRGKRKPVHAAEDVGAVMDRASASKTTPTASTSTRPSSVSTLRNPPTMPSEQSEVENAFFSHVTAAIETDFWRRRSEYLSSQGKAAQRELEREQGMENPFPDLIKEAEQKTRRFQYEHSIAKKQETGCQEKTQKSGGSFIRLLLEIVNAKDDQIKTLTDQVGAIQQELEGLRSQQMEQDERSKASMQRLEEFQPQQLSVDQCLKKFDDKLNNIDSKVERHDAKHTEADRSIRNLEKTQSQHRADLEGIKAYSETLGTNQDTLRESMNGLQQSSTSMDERIQELASIPAALARVNEEEIQKVQTQLKVTQKQVLDQTERTRQSLNVKLEAMQEEWKTKYGKFHPQSESLSSTIEQVLATKCDGLGSDLESLSRRVSTLEEAVKTSDAATAANHAQVETVQKEIASLAKEVFGQLSTLKATTAGLDTARMAEDVKILRMQLAKQANKQQDLAESFGQEIQSLNDRLPKADMGDHDLANMAARGWDAYETLKAELAGLREWCELRNRDGADQSAKHDEQINQLQADQDKLAYFHGRLTKRHESLSQHLTFIKEGPAGKPVLEYNKKQLDALIEQAMEIPVKRDVENLYSMYGNLAKQVQNVTTSIGRVETDLATCQDLVNRNAYASQRVEDETTSRPTVLQISSSDDDHREEEIPETTKKTIKSPPSSALKKQPLGGETRPPTSSLKRKRSQREELSTNPPDDIDDEPLAPRRRKARR
ncbi:hypothetical protein Z517_05877 [Fonsecaea pedrosoi CBS 271.37]|uniref:Uncharacterized protein n=1 Tax=Fonsecaea pedrosoi CBS 271.37 TaxID=1442368 RepID=A0A0D2GL52_9EURO|nr:uncharacterized protein Z517_05877 [Fonsecaea pedrosoi CBS 271.37]KIW79265.1 hypothetical protein Z517_05877 [Fonsecaea pedrosoi CBS 271.37]